MFKQSVSLFAEDFLPDFHLSLIIMNASTVFYDQIAVLVNGVKFDLKIQIDDIPLLVNDLEAAAKSLVDKIKSGTPKNKIPEVLVDNKMGLATHGYTALNRIFHQKMLDYIDLILKNLDKSIKFPVISIRSDLFSIPWEWLYNEPPQSVSTNNLLSTMKPFWGMSFVVARMDPPGSSKFYNNFSSKSPMKIGIIADENLDFATEEATWLKNSDSTKIKPSQFKISNNSSDWDFVEEINNFLNRDFDIIHLACHAEAEKELRLSSYFSVSNGWQYQIRNLTAYPQVSIRAPLVFFNACSTGIRNPLETFGFVREFQKAGASNIIAIEASIESQVAYSFAQTFYSFFLNGSELGEALIKSRHQIIKSNKEIEDVVTLFYSLYGNPRAKILQ